MKHFETNLSQKVAQTRHCKLCDYFTCKTSDYKKHLQTIKHKSRENETFETEMKPNVAKNLQCLCGINFNNRTTLWRHKKLCNFEKNNVETKPSNENSNSSLNFITPELVMELIKDNKEMKQIILEFVACACLMASMTAFVVSVKLSAPCLLISVTL